MNKARRWLVAFAFALVVSGGWRWWRVTHPTAPIITYTPVAGRDGGELPHAPWRVHGHLAVVISRGEQDTVRLDGRSFAAGGKVSDLCFSADGGHVSWLAKSGGATRAYVDGRAGQAGALIFPVFLPGGGWAYTYRVGQRQRLLVNERPHGLFDRIDLVDTHGGNSDRDWHGGASPALPPTERPRFWVGRNGKLRWLLTADQRYGPFDRIDAVHLSPDGRHWACVVRGGSRETVLRDGRPMSWHDRVLSPRQPSADDCCCGEGDGPFTADSQHLLWQVRDGRRETYRIDERPIPIKADTDAWQEPIPTGDGSHLITAANPGSGVRYWVDGRPLSSKGDVTEQVVTGAGPAWAAVVGRAGQVYVATHRGDFGPFAQVTQPVISHTTGSMIWAAQSAKAWRIWRDGQPGEPVPSPNPPRFGPLGRLAYCEVRDGERSAMWVNGRIGPWFDGVDEPTFSEDGRHVAYQARQSGRIVAVLDERVVSKMNSVRGLIFAPNGRGLLVNGDTGRWDVPWLAQSPLADSGPLGPGRIAWSRDGRHWAYLSGLVGKMILVHNGRRVAIVRDGSNPAISPDGRHTVLEAVPAGASESRLMVDGQWLPLTCEHGPNGAFGPDGCYRRVVRRDGRTCLIEIRWPR